MSGIEIFSLITGIITVTEAITQAYEGIKTLPGLPEAFHAVGKRLPLVESTLRDAKKREKDPVGAESDDLEALKILVDDCSDKTEELRIIFLKLSQSKGKPVFQAYRTLVAHMGKKGRVELLMREILRDVATLTSYRVFCTATQHQVEELKKAIEEMGQVDPSLPDSFFEERGGTSSHSGQGHIYNFSGSSTLNEVAGSIYNASGDINFGDRDVDSDCLAALWVTAPRDDKKRIEDAKGGLLRDSYCWVAESKEFRKWRDQDIPLLWVSGDPGKGKTMSVCGIIDELSPSTSLDDQTSDTLLSYFFCEASDSRVNSAPSVLRGIIWLLIKQRPSLISCVQEKHQHSGKMLFEGRNAWSALRTIFTDLLRSLRSQPIYLIIDALDECKEGWKSLVQLILEQSSRSHVKWLVSSRNRPDIQELFATSSDKLRLSLELNEGAVAAAVDSYIQHKVNELAEVKRYGPDLRLTVHSHLSSKSQSTFLWVSLACQMLQDAPKWDTLSELEAFPSGLEPLYGRMLQQILAERTHRSKFYQQIVSIVLTVFQPISLDDLRSVANIFGDMSDDDSLVEIIGLCGSFLILRGRIIYFVHDSARSFLINSNRDFFYDGEDQHRLLFSNSLQAMVTSLRRDICSSESPKQQPAEDPLAPLRYTCANWILHLINSGSDTRNKELVDDSQVDKFLRQHYLHWLEALGHMKAISAGIVSMMKLEAIILNHTSQFTRLVRDETRFIRYHRWIIEEVPLQVYTSALVFSPAGSITREIYRREEPRWMTAKPVMEDNWSDSILTMEGHRSGVTSVSFSPNGRFLVSASKDETAKVWDVATGECIQTLTGHTQPVTSVAISGKNSLIVSASYDCTMKTWDGEQGRCLRTHMDLKDVAISVAFTQDGRWLASGSVNGTVRLWDSQVEACLEMFHGHSKPVTTVAWSRDGHFLASVSKDSVRIWDPQRKDCLHSYTTDEFRHIAFSPDDKLAAAAFGSVTIWDPATGERLRVIAMESFFAADCIAFSWDGLLLAASSDIFSMQIFDARTGRCVHKFEDKARSISFSPTSHSLASTNGPRIKIRDLAVQDPTRETLLGRSQLPLPFHLTSFSPDGSLVASSTGDAKIRLWRSANSTFVQALDFSMLTFMPLFSADSRLLALFNSREVQVWDIVTGIRLQSVADEFIEVETVALSHDHRWLALAPKKGPVSLWDLTSGGHIQKLGGDSDSNTTQALAFSHDSRYLAAGSRNCIKIWDSALWRCKQTLKASVDPYAMVFSPDCCWLAVSHSSPYYFPQFTEIKTVDLEKGACVTACKLDRYCIVLAFDPARSLLETTMGTFELSHHPVWQPRLEGYGISADREWIVWGAKGKLERVLWLPPEYRPYRVVGMEWRSVVFSGPKVAIGLESGRILTLEFVPEGPLPVSTWPLFRPTLGGYLQPFHVHRELPLSRRRLSRGSSLD